MRKLVVALLALPVLLEIYPEAVLRQWRVLRIGTALGLGAVVALTAIGLARPSPTTASLPSPIVPVTQAAFRTVVETGVDLDAAATIVFSTPMDPASVAAAIGVDPPTAIDLTWDATGTRLTIGPGTRWAAARYHTITVGSGALARSGRPLTTLVRASFLTRGLAMATLGTTRAIGSQVALDTAVMVRFDRPVDPASLRRALRSTPAVEGTVTAVPGLASGPAFVFTPSRPLRADTTYRFVLDGVLDDDGLRLAPVTLTVRTIRAPTVVRFRPVGGTKGVTRDAAVSVRFTERMDRASTKLAFSVAVDGAVINGAVRFAEGDTVLVFTPTSRLRASGKIVAQVGTEARSAAGAPLAAVARASFRPPPRRDQPLLGQRRRDRPRLPNPRRPVPRRSRHPRARPGKHHRNGLVEFCRALLPWADELHADRRPDLRDRRLQQPRRP
ncbi:MAG: Ig-like domain-containing protein [Candidatus Limnocylindrales bacterium]